MRRWFGFLLATAYLTFISALFLVLLGLQGIFDLSNYRNSGFSEVIEIVSTAILYSPLVGLAASLVALVIARRSGVSRWAAAAPLALNGALISAAILFSIAMPNH